MFYLYSYDRCSGLRNLEKNAFSADTAKTGNEAIKKLETQSYGVLLIDLNFLDIEGMRLSRVNTLCFFRRVMEIADEAISNR
jgi:hypothetical protein